MDGTDGTDRMDGSDGLDRRPEWNQRWNQDPSVGAQGPGPSQGQGDAQDRDDPRDAQQTLGPTDARELPAIPIPGRFLRNQAPHGPASPPSPSSASSPSPALSAGDDLAPTRSIPVLSRPGYAPGASAYGSASGNGLAPTPAWPAQSASAPSAPASPVAPHGAYIVEETQELVVPATPAAQSPAAHPSVGEPSAPRVSVLNAAGAAAAAYRQPEDVGRQRATPEALSWRGGEGLAAPGNGMSSWASQAQPPAGGGYSGAGAAAGNQPPRAPADAAATPVARQQPQAAAPPHAGPSHVGWHAAENWGTVSITMSANTAAGLSYLFGFLTGIFFYFGERQNRYVRFHAWQSTALSLILILLGALVYVGVWIETIKVQDAAWTVVTLLLAGLIGLGMFVLWIWIMAAAFSGHYVRLPIIGDRAEYFAAPPHDLYSQYPTE